MQWVAWVAADRQMTAEQGRGGDQDLPLGFSGGLHEGDGCIGATDNKAPLKGSYAVEGGSSRYGDHADHAVLLQHDIAGGEGQRQHSPLQPRLGQYFGPIWSLQQSRGSSIAAPCQRHSI